MTNQQILPIDNADLQVVADDPYLAPFAEALLYRRSLCNKWISRINQDMGIDEFTTSYRYYGFNMENNVIVYREWAPNAHHASLIGDFNSWDPTKNVMTRNQFGVWECKVPEIFHLSKVKVRFSVGDTDFDRIPAYIGYATQDLSVSESFTGVFYRPETPFQFKFPSPKKVETPRIYEAHVGISSSEGKVTSYVEFMNNVIPRIVYLGYNTIQLMAILEHPYYASFGYQVTNIYAPSSRFGTPDELKALIDCAHSHGITVLLDIVHSHSSKNVLDGLNMFDGSDSLYFHSGGKGNHSLWDSKLFNYSEYEVLRFLLSNLRYWLEEFRFDGFRFDGVTSMLYNHHGIGTGFSGNYHEYFGDSVDLDSVTYLSLANEIMHNLFPHIITIAEDVSGFPTLCRTLREGGVGFDYRLNMAVPDMWIKLLKEFRDEDWNMGNIVHTLTNRRWKEKTISYAESHDQALVGDKTLAFWLMDKEMYTNMSILSSNTHIIDRGMALLCLGLGGDGYLTFMGNEFGHPEWLDFPRKGNNNSYHYARRQYNLIDDDLLRYKFLNEFDKSMQELEQAHSFLQSSHQYVSLAHESDKIIVFERGSLLFVVNFSDKSFEGYRVGTCWNKVHVEVLDSDSVKFGGHGRVMPSRHFAEDYKYCGREYSIRVYIPSRTALVLACEE